MWKLRAQRKERWKSLFNAGFTHTHTHTSSATAVSQNHTFCLPSFVLFLFLTVSFCPPLNTQSLTHNPICFSLQYLVPTHPPTHPPTRPPNHPQLLLLAGCCCVHKDQEETDTQIRTGTFANTIHIIYDITIACGQSRVCRVY